MSAFWVVALRPNGDFIMRSSLVAPALLISLVTVGGVLWISSGPISACGPRHREPIAHHIAYAGAPAIEKPEPWGTIKGHVVWGETDLPEPKEIAITRDVKAIQACLKGGKLFAEDWVVNKDDRGVRWVYVWIMPSPGKNGAKPDPMPIHPSLEKIKDKEVVIDVPCGRFEPHLVALRKGQTLVARNSAVFAHNFKLDGGLDGPSDNVILPAGKRIEFADLKASQRPIMVADNIHPWMKGWLRVFDHPYFAVTDEHGGFEIKNAPAGESRLFIWHEETGWIHEGGKQGQPITIKAGESKDLGDVDVRRR
jgi:hypothetical protein